MMFTDKVVIVTGASSGIGAGTAVAFAKEGAKLVLGGRNKENLEKTVQACQEQGIKVENVLAVVGDLTIEENCNQIVDKAVQTFGRIDVVVNNAGCVKVGNIEQATITDVDNMLNTNVRSVFMVTKRAVPHLRENKGSIVNVSSAVSVIQAGGLLAYGMSKAALNHFTQSLAQDVGPSGVRVNAIIPGAIDTPIFTRPGGFIEGHPEKKAEMLAQMAQLHALGRYGTVDDCANLILFLASNKASFMTGALVPVEGGMLGKNSF